MNNQLLSDFRNHLKYIEQLSSQTILAYMSDLELFAKKYNCLTADSEIIRDYLYQLSKTHESSSVARTMSSLRKFYDYCLIGGYIKNNPTEFFSVSQKRQSIPHYLTHQEVEQLLNFELKTNNDYLDKALIEMLYSSGLRVSELINLKNSDINMDEGILKVKGKGNKERIIPVSLRARQALIDYYENAKKFWLKIPTQYLFINSKCHVLSRQNVYNRLQKRASQCGLSKKLTPHMLRHSFASSLINAGADLRSVQELLGHKDITTTQIYTHLDQKKKHEMYEKFHPGKLLTVEGEEDEKI